MAKKGVTTFVLDKDTAKLIGALSSLVASVILARLVERGVFDDDDLELIFARIASGGMGDKSLDIMAKLIADVLRSQVTTIRAN